MEYSVIHKSVLSLAFLLITACALPSDPEGPGGALSATGDVAAPSAFPGAIRTEVMIFIGPSAWTAEVAALERVLYNHHITYLEMDSEHLNLMTLEEMSRFGLIVIPGGDAPTMTMSLSASTRAKMRKAVQEKGISYLGFCAGAWIAIAPAPTQPDGDVIYGVGVVDGPLQEYYSLTPQGVEYSIQRATFPDGTSRNLLWYGGPVTPNIAGGVIARYPDGNPAITQIRSGRGWVIVSGLHPAANPFILNALGLREPEAVAPDLAWTLLDSAIRQVPVKAF